MKTINREEEQDALWEATSNLGLVEEVDLPSHLKTIEKERISVAMDNAGFVIAKAARSLGISRERLHHRIKVLDLRFN